MIFQGLARFATKHYKVIFILWLLIAIVSFPLFQRMGDALTYEDREFMPEDIESKRAEDLLQENFPNSTLNQVVIVVRGDYVLSPKYIDYSRWVKERLEGNPEIVKLQSVNTCYSTYETILSKYWELMNESWGMVYERIYANITQYHSLIYRLKENVTELHSILYGLADNVTNINLLIYGFPLRYLEAWLLTLNKSYIPYLPNPPLTIHQINEKIGEEISVQLRDLLKGRSQVEALLATGYFKAFVDVWDATFPNPYPDEVSLLRRPTPKEKLEGVIQEAASQFFNQPLIPQEVRLFVSSILDFFDIDSWSDSSSVKEFVYNTVQTYLDLGEEVQIFLEKVYDLGEEISEEDIRSLILEAASMQLPEGFEEIVAEIYDLGMEPKVEDVKALAKRFTDEFMKDIREKYPVPEFPKDLPPAIYRHFISQDNRTMLILVLFEEEVDNRELVANVEAIKSSIKDYPERVESYVTGTSAFSADFESSVKTDVNNIDRATILLVIILLGIIFTSIVAPLAPLVSVGIAIITAEAMIYLIAVQGVKIHYFVQSLMTVVMMGAGVDYCIFMIYRYIEERSMGIDKGEAVARSVTYAGEAVASSGGTVMVGFGSMMLSRFGMLKTIGFGLTLGIGIALLVALTLVPSILMLIGDKIVWPRKRLKRGGLRTRFLRRAASTSVHRASWIFLFFLILTLILGFFALNLDRSYNVIQMLPATEAKEGYMLISSEFGVSSISQIFLTIKADAPLVDPNGGLEKGVYEGVERIVERLGGLEGVDTERILSPTRPLGEVVPYSEINDPSRRELIYNYIGKDNRSLLIYIGLTYDYSSNEALATVSEIRRILKGLQEAGSVPGDWSILVGGPTASFLDITELVDRDFLWLIIPAVLIGIYLVLLFLLGSIFTPLRLILTILMSVVITLGVLVVTVQIGLNLPIYWMVPTLLFSTLMGLGMDYDIFLVSRIREEVEEGKTDEEAIVEAVEKTGVVITACGAIMATALGTLIISSILILQEVGFTLAFAIALDAFIVRIFLVPSIMMLMKKWNWWAPKRIQRVKR